MQQLWLLPEWLGSCRAPGQLLILGWLWGLTSPLVHGEHPEACAALCRLLVFGWPVGPLPLLLWICMFPLYYVYFLECSSLFNAPIGPLSPPPSPLLPHWFAGCQSVPPPPPSPLLIGCCPPYKTPGPYSTLVFRPGTLLGINPWKPTRKTPLVCFVLSWHFWILGACGCVCLHRAGGWSACVVALCPLRGAPSGRSAAPGVPDLTWGAQGRRSTVPATFTASCVTSCLNQRHSTLRIVIKKTK